MKKGIFGDYKNVKLIIIGCLDKVNRGIFKSNEMRI